MVGIGITISILMLEKVGKVYCYSVVLVFSCVQLTCVFFPIVSGRVRNMYVSECLGIICCFVILKLLSNLNPI